MSPFLESCSPVRACFFVFASMVGKQIHRHSGVRQFQDGIVMRIPATLTDWKYKSDMYGNLFGLRYFILLNNF